MRSIIVSTFVTLDGVMQAPGGPEEDPSGGFTHGGWGVNQWDDAMYAAMGELFAEPFDLLLGRRTYEIFAAHWPHVGDGERGVRGGTASDIDDPVASALNSARKYVASRTLDTVEWSNSTLLEGDVAAAVSDLKLQDGPNILVQGSSDLIQTLLAHELVDEFRIWTFPVVVGPGKRLFGLGDVDLGSFAFEMTTDQEVERRARLAADH